MRRFWDWFSGLSEAGKIGLVGAVITTVGGGVFSVINALIPVLAGGGNENGLDNKPPSSVQASKTPDRTVTSASTTSPANQPPDSGSPVSSDAPAPSATLSSDSNAIQYTGPVRIAEKGPDLDVDPPNADESGEDVRLALIDPPRITGYGVTNEPTLALWTGSAMPNRQQCSDRISTQGVPTVEVKKGTVVCVKTDGGRIAVVTITSTSNYFSTGEMAQVTVWSEVSG
ncbi:hypothetical protein AB0N14_39530 [Streptomyces sp. NPDC051104]|uniref:hypothetical protein n=1 Tax=Streptomyces sp. NPDC051104 TaxID=3155044 RepID=UPI00342295E9